MLMILSKGTRTVFSWG